MTDMSWQHGPQARAALNAIVTDPGHGVAALSSAQTMSNLLKDLLPDAPREKSMLVAAAEAGLASSLREHVAQGMDPNTAIRLTASSFSASTPFTPEACNWVAGEIAIALGIAAPAEAGAALAGSAGQFPRAGVPVSAGGSSQPATRAPGGHSTGQPRGYQPAYNDQPTQGYPQYGQGAYGQGAGYGQGGHGQGGHGHGGHGHGGHGHGGAGYPPAGYGQGGYGQGGYGQAAGGYGIGGGYGQPAPPRRSRRGLLALGGLAVAVVVVIAVVALTGSPTAKAHHTRPVAKTVESLNRILNPPGLTPIGTKCELGGLAGLAADTVVHRVKCDTSVSRLYLWAYQFDNAADYQRGFRHLQNYLVFKPARAGTNCPPGGGAASGATNWRSDNPKYHSYTGQYLDCLTIHGTYGNEVTYLWTLPSQHVVFLAQSWDTNIPFSTLDHWWAHLSYG